MGAPYLTTCHAYLLACHVPIWLHHGRLATCSVKASSPLPIQRRLCNLEWLPLAHPLITTPSLNVLSWGQNRYMMILAALFGFNLTVNTLKLLQCISVLEKGPTIRPSFTALFKLSTSLAPYSKAEGLFRPWLGHLTSPSTPMSAPWLRVFKIYSTLYFWFIPSLSASASNLSGIIQNLRSPGL